MEYISVAQAASKWGITKRRVQKYCIDGRIEGVVRFSRLWAIPQDTPKPTDPRKKQSQTDEKQTKHDSNISKRLISSRFARW